MLNDNGKSKETEKDRRNARINSKTAGSVFAAEENSSTHCDIMHHTL